MYSATFSRLLVYVSVLLFFTSASAKPTGVTKNLLSGSLAERAVQSGRPLKQFDAKLPRASQLGRRQGVPSALSNAASSASNPSANSAGSSDATSANFAVDPSNLSATTANPPSDFVNIAGNIINSDGITNSNSPNSLNLAIDLEGTQGTDSPLAFSGTPSLFGSSGSTVTSGSISSSDASDSTTAPGSTSASGSSTGPGSISAQAAPFNNGQTGLLSVANTVFGVNAVSGVPAPFNAPPSIGGSNPTTSSGSFSGATVNIDSGVSNESTAPAGLSGILSSLFGVDPSNNLVQPASGPTINGATDFPALDIEGSAVDVATGTFPNPGTIAGNPLVITVSETHNPTVSPGDVAANSVGDVASGAVSGGVAGGTAQTSANPTLQSNDTPLISTIGTDATTTNESLTANANANAALTP